MDTIIETKDVWKIYGMNGVAVEAVRGVDLTVGAGEFVAIVGPSGSGKSSLLHLLGAMDTPTRGQVLFAGHSLAAMKDGQRTDLRARQIGFVFQTFNLLPMLTAFENVEVAMRLAGTRLAERRARTAELLDLVGLGERAHHRPRLLLTDEPTGNLDTKTGAVILNLLRRVCDEDKQTIVMVTHDFRAAGYADRVLILRDGYIRGETRLEGGADAHKTWSQLIEAGF